MASHTYDSGPVVRILDYWQGKLRFKSYALLPFVSERTIERCEAYIVVKLTSCILQVDFLEDAVVV